MNAPARRVRGIWAALARVPTYFYRGGLGWMLGRRFLMIVHRGRRTGRVRRTVLEVARYDPIGDEYTVVAAFGPGSDWYQNLLRHPVVEVQVGRRRFVPAQRRLTEEEADAALAGYERQHPRLFRLLMRVIGLRHNGSAARRRDLATVLPMIAFRPLNGCARRPR